MSSPRILFGVGATRAGTSWLYEWLSGHEDCHFRAVKEVHYFNSLEWGRMAERQTQLVKSRARMEAQNADLLRIIDFKECEAVFVGEKNDQGYLKYLKEGRENASVVGDITPAYGLLPVSRLRDMAALGDTRFLYILRDPVARLWSHVRMIARRREADTTVKIDSVEQVLRNTLRGDEPHIAIRSDYRGAMERLANAVPEAQRLFVFFEELMTGEVTEKVCAFLGIPTHPPLARIIHRGTPLELTSMQTASARKYLAEQYEFVETAMGRVPDDWRYTERVL